MGKKGSRKGRKRKELKGMRKGEERRSPLEFESLVEEGKHKGWDTENEKENVRRTREKSLRNKDKNLCRETLIESGTK